MEALLGASTTMEQTLLAIQASLIRPIFLPSIVAQSHAQGEHGVDVLRFPMHPSPFESRLHHLLVATFHRARADGPAVALIAGIVHRLAALLQVVHFLLDLRIAHR